MEVMVVTAIIALMAMFAFAMLGPAKKKSLTAPCTQNLRQLYTSWSLYRSGNEDKTPYSFAEFTDIADSRILKCPEDDSAGANEWDTKNLKVPVSYFYLPPNEDLWEDMRLLDPNHGVMYCVLHGTPVSSGTPRDPRTTTKGLVLRLLLDGSIQRVNVGFICSATKPPMMVTRPSWILLTSAPCPDEWCIGEPCGGPPGSY
jgi:hypothetical protein